MTRRGAMRTMSGAVAIRIALALAALSVAGETTQAQGPLQMQLTVSGSPSTLRIQSAVAGHAPAAVIDATTTYTVDTKHKDGSHRITAHLSAPLPAGVTMTVTLAAPTGGTSAGPVSLDTTPRDVVVNLRNNGASTRTITYNLSATTAAGVLAARTVSVVFNLLSAP